MIKKNLITAISIIGLLAILNPANANEKSGLRLYHVKINKFDLKAKCIWHEDLQERKVGVTSQENKRLVEKFGTHIIIR